MKTYSETTKDQTGTAILQETAEDQSSISQQFQQIDLIIRRLIEHQKENRRISNDLAEWQQESDQFIGALDKVIT
jgi:hypothetical protein